MQILYSNGLETLVSADEISTDLRAMLVVLATLHLWIEPKTRSRLNRPHGAKNFAAHIDTKLPAIQLPLQLFGQNLW